MGKIVVGVDGSDGARAALHWALDEASVRGAELAVVAAWQSSAVAGLASVGAFPARDLIEQSARDRLDEVVAAEGLADRDDVTVTLRGQSWRARPLGMAEWMPKTLAS